MAEHEHHYTQRRYPCPAVLSQDIRKHRRVSRFGQRVLTHIYHEHYRHDYFICGKSQNKCKDYCAVHAEKPPQRVKKLCTYCKHGAVPHLQVCHKPYYKPRRSCHCDRSAQHKDSSVKKRTHQYLSYLRAAIWRKLQGKGSRHSFKHRSRQDT